jgi:hypothetical protein
MRSDEEMVIGYNLSMAKVDCGNNNSLGEPSLTQLHTKVLNCSCTRVD